ncbi:MAG: SDR family oxidoreductase [Alphaproteobacteria bacterium]|nr:SDR family oxidoreductase [Alphaproteobacteria bacterium]
MVNTLLILGHGYTARALSLVLVPRGWRVIGTTQNAENLLEIRELGVEARLWPGSDLGDILAQATHILVAAGPDALGDPVLNGLWSQLAQCDENLRWIGYLSTTAVYGDHAGGWVDEETPLAATTKRGKWRVQAEMDWNRLAHEAYLPVHIFRLAGIYGPGRGPFAKVRAGTARRIIKSGQVFSRIHVDDIVQVLLASMAAPNPGAVYNVCDDEAVPPEDVIGLAARLLELPVPEAIDFDATDLSPMARSFYAESKRVHNDRIKRDLGVELLYPTYRQGLKALHQQKED